MALRGRHLARPVENGAFPDCQARGSDRACDAARLEQFDPSLRRNVPVHLAADLENLYLDLGLDLTALADNEDLTADDVSRRATVQPKGASKGQVSLEPGALSQEAGDFAKVAADRLTTILSSSIRCHWLDPLPPFPLSPVQDDLDFFTGCEGPRQPSPCL
jgi:hypothetical protein